jgi:hypothetical protein
MNLIILWVQFTTFKIIFFLFEANVWVFINVHRSRFPSKTLPKKQRFFPPIGAIKLTQGFL